MTTWIEVKGGNFPPDCVPVLLLVHQYNTGKYGIEARGSFFEAIMLLGFYSAFLTENKQGEFEKAFYYHDDFMGHHRIESKFTKVIAWTLPPALPTTGFEEYKEKIDIPIEEGEKVVWTDEDFKSSLKEWESYSS